MYYYELDDVDRETVAKARKAMAYHQNGDPVKDAVDEDDMIDAMQLLLSIVDSGAAK